MLVGFRILEHYSEFQNPALNSPQETFSEIPDFTGKIFLNSGIQNPLKGPIPTCYGKGAAITNLLFHDGTFNNNIHDH